MNPMLTRRQWLGHGAALLSVPIVGGCDLPGGPKLDVTYGWSNLATFEGQRLLLSRNPLAREFRPEQASAVFPSINTTEPKDATYQRSKAAAFADWRLPVGGLVGSPRRFSIADLRSMPAGRRRRCIAASRDGLRSAAGPASHCRRSCRSSI